MQWKQFDSVQEWTEAICLIIISNPVGYHSMYCTQRQSQQNAIHPTTNTAWTQDPANNSMQDSAKDHHSMFLHLNM